MGTMLFLISFFSAYVAVSRACSCAPKWGPGRFCGYKAVFRGTATAVVIEEEDPDDRYAGDKIYTVTVDDVYMMPDNITVTTGSTIRLITGKYGSLCGASFPLNVDYVFFAGMTVQGKAGTSLCSGNTPWDRLDLAEQEVITSNLKEFCLNHPE